MTLYNDFGVKIKTNLEDFVSVFRRSEQTIGHVNFFGLPERYCNFRESQVKWQDSNFHLNEAKVRNKMCFSLRNHVFSLLDGN